MTAPPLKFDRLPEYSYIIVGGGTAGEYHEAARSELSSSIFADLDDLLPAGCVLADRLSADPNITVAVIEGGPSDHDIPQVLQLADWLTLLGGDYDYQYPTTEQPRGNSHILHSRAKVLGEMATDEDAKTELTISSLSARRLLFAQHFDLLPTFPRGLR